MWRRYNAWPTWHGQIWTTTKLLLIAEQKIECIPEKARVKHTKLKLTRRVELPPHTEVLVSCKVGQGTKYFGTPHMVVQSSGNSWRYAEDSLVIRLSLLARDSETDCIPVMNLSDAPRTLHPGARIGYVYPVTSLKQAYEVLEVDPSCQTGTLSLIVMTRSCWMCTQQTPWVLV